MSTLRLTPRGLLAFGQLHPCTIGRTGLTEDKREGDGATPRGTLRLTAMLYRPDRLAAPAPWARPIRPGDLWSDDAEDPLYNRLVRAPHARSHEALRRADPLYDLILVTDWNAEGRPGAGSAIFMHQWRRPGWPTAGCIAPPRPALHRLAARLRPGDVILT
ncbi:L,D-transpeptidase [Pseudoroseicyclus sp. CXY001]|uniref:L,D-transpeptidase family protein n=1 Tax=Pseudoroseicyclus sp. CXY001 TaxID=3242492 RepID=UPI003570B9AF